MRLRLSWNRKRTRKRESLNKKGAEGGTYGKLDQQAADLMYKIDEAIYRRTNGRIHLRGRVLPLGIAGLGVAQMVIYGISLEMLPGPLLIWLAHDIHTRFSKEPPMLVVPKPATMGEETARDGWFAGGRHDFSFTRRDGTGSSLARLLDRDCCRESRSYGHA